MTYAKDLIVVLFACFFMIQNSRAVPSQAMSKKEVPTIYKTSGKWIMGYNLNRYNNRPLYINNTNGFILTGDKPLIRLAKGDKLYGTLTLSISRDGKTTRIDDFDQIESRFAAGEMEWRLTDSKLGEFVLILRVLPSGNGIGMAVQVKAENRMAGDQLCWNFEGAKRYPRRQLSWDFDVMGHPELLSWKDIEINSEEPGFRGIFPEKASDDHCLSFILGADDTIHCHTGLEAKNDWDNAQSKLEELVGRIKINTPDANLNAMARASLVAVNGSWYPPVFVHGCMLWNARFPGWRTIFGGTMYGWHDRVLAEAKFYIDSQVKKSDKKVAKADPKTLMTEQHPDSRFYGLGRILKDQNFYDMQSQFFDQLIEEYRWTADPELVKILREALELHLEWIRDCFDPDGDGVYESYMNSWPTDSQWYNGGGTAEETSYAYRGHLAARDMARNAGDKRSESFHNLMIEKIRKGFFDKLWISNKGHAGAYREQGGHERLHEDPCLYSIFLPVDANLTSPLQAIESVYYTEWALQNDTLPIGGRQVWGSNWVPGIWSIREKWPGDNYHLALSYFQAGLPQDAWDIMRGTYLHTAFNHHTPGNLGGHQGGTDFGDCVHTFSRTLVEGLFGFKPDYPNGKVELFPQFPKDWNYASVELPDVKIAFERKNTMIHYSFELKKEANLFLKLPVQCSNIKNVTVEGAKASWELEPGIGCSIVKIKLKNAKKVNLSIEQQDELPYYKPVFVEGNVGEKISLKAVNAKIISVEDPQQSIDYEIIQKGILQAVLARNKGYHTVVARVLVGKSPQYRVFRIKINDPAGDAKEAARYLKTVPEKANWECIDIAPLYNADITTIYKQSYLSPRPNTVSLRLGTDGYSPWTFWHWKSTPPEIKTDQVKHLMKDGKKLVTPQGVPFIWNDGDRTVAFTSMWDNYPVKIDFPVNKTGKAIYFLVSGSTNVMQCQIANALIRLNYANGKTDSLALVPPVNYWNLSTITASATSPGQDSRNDYLSETDKFCMPRELPQVVQLGENCRAMLLNLKLLNNVELKSITLETLSQEVVVGLIGVTLLKNE
jgi:hypothetical protein